MTSLRGRLTKTYENCKGAVGIADDVQVFGNKETHDRNFRKQQNAQEKQALSIILISVLLRPNVVVF